MWWKLCTGLALFRKKTLFSTVVHTLALGSILMLTVTKQLILVFNSLNYFYWVFDCWKYGSIRFCIGRERSIMSCLQPLLHVIIVPVRKYTVLSVSPWACTNASKCMIVCACTCHMHSHCKQKSPPVLLFPCYQHQLSAANHMSELDKNVLTAVTATHWMLA